jgi:diaminopimelate decarboxylase
VVGAWAAAGQRFVDLYVATTELRATHAQHVQSDELWQGYVQELEAQVSGLETALTARAGGSDIPDLAAPGRFIAGNAGILITRVEYVKQTGVKNFVIVDAAMNDLARPALYDSYHEIVPLTRQAGDHLKKNQVCSDVVGPICESSDYFCKNRMLPKVGEGNHLALLSAGAYGFVMASNYNVRPFPAEVLVKGSQAEIVRKRQPLKQLWASESIPKWLK